MTEREGMLPISALEVLVYAQKVFIAVNMLCPFIVVSEDQAFLSFQARENFFNIFTAEEHIAQNENGVTLSCTVIPVIDYKFVHFFNGWKWAIAMFDDVCVTEVRISGEIKHR